MYTLDTATSFFTSIKTCTVDGLGWLSTYICKDGYVPLTLASNAKNTNYKIGGCYSCAGTSDNTPAVNTNAVSTNEALWYASCTAPTTFTASFIPATG